MPSLFEPGGDIWGTKGTGLKFTEVQRLRAKLNTAKAQAPKCDGIDVDESVLHHEGQTYLLPLDFTNAVKNGTLRRTDDSPRTVLKYIDGPVEETLLKWESTGQPRYWVHVPNSDGSTTAWPVYGYVADYGYGYSNPPMIKGELPDWDAAEWLCRCAQCGRELPPSQYFKNTNGRLKAICRGCISTNRIVDKIWNRMYKYGIRYINDEELTLLDDMRLWYEGLWRRNLLPRGDYCTHVIGEQELQDRMNLTIRHRRGSAPRRPPYTSHSKITEIYSLMEDANNMVNL